MYITTFSGKKVSPGDPRVEDLLMEDIAHALSLLCRGNGHVKHFYSVAQHSINCCQEALSRGYSTRMQLACLMHDASEAYLSDVTRPVKAALPEYRKMEDQLQAVIETVFLTHPLSRDEYQLMRAVDDDMLAHELFHLLSVGEHVPSLLRHPADFSAKDPTNVESEFLRLFARLSSCL